MKKISASILALGFALTVTIALSAAAPLTANASPGSLTPMASEPSWAVTVQAGDEGELRDAINNADDGVPTIIELTDDITLSSDTAISVPDSKIIKLTSAIGTGAPYTIDADGEDISVIENAGELWLEDVNITGANKLTDPDSNGVNGGGVLNTGTLVMMDGASIYGNTVTADENGGCGGGVYNTGDFTMLGGTIENNKADINSYFSRGGGVFNNGTFTMDGGTISGNSADAGGGLYSADGFDMTTGTVSDNSANGDGGGVCVEGDFSMTGGSVIDNKAGLDGGGVYGWFGATFLISGQALISGNESYNYGGGVAAYYYSSSTKIEGGTITDNKTGLDGGGVYGDGSTEFVVGGQALISENQADASGGGVAAYYYDSTRIEGGKITNNKAVDGGGFYTPNGATMTGGLVSLNTATGDGGGINAPSLELEGGTISQNTATGNGGGIFISETSALTMTAGTISGNSAANGGGVYGDTEMTISAGTISGNTASADGGGVWIYDLTKLSVSSGVAFSGNTASKVVKSPLDLYMPAGVTWTVPFAYGNSNYDINWDAETAYLAFVQDSYAVAPAVSGANGYLPGETVTINAGTRSGYSFMGWTVVSGGVTLASSSSATTTFIMPAQNVTVQASWGAPLIPNTGDNNAAGFVFALFAAAAGALCIVAFGARRAKTEQR